MNTDERYYISSNKFSTQERQTKRGRVYDIVFRIATMDGVEKQKKLSGFKTKGDAKQAYLDFVQQYCELAKGKSIRKPQADISTSTEDMTVGTLAEQYLAAQINQNKNATVYEKRLIFKNILIPRFATVDVRELTKPYMLKWQDELWMTINPKTGKYFSYKYLSKVRTFMSTFLSWCAERYDTTNYLLQIKKPKRRVAPTKMLFWTRAEFDRFIAIVDDPLYHMLFMTMFYTGRRKGEIFALTPTDIDIAGKSISFTKSLTRKTLNDETYEITSTKAEKDGKTPICDTLMKALLEYTPTGKFYFGGSKPLAATTVQRIFDKYAARAGVKRIRIHDLRHSFVSMIIHLGAPMTVVADLIGDTLEQVIKTYAHLYEEDKLNIIAKIG